MLWKSLKISLNINFKRKKKANILCTLSSKTHGVVHELGLDIWMVASVLSCQAAKQWQLIIDLQGQTWYSIAFTASRTFIFFGDTTLNSEWVSSYLTRWLKTGVWDSLKRSTRRSIFLTPSSCDMSCDTFGIGSITKKSDFRNTRRKMLQYLFWPFRNILDSWSSVRRGERWYVYYGLGCV